MNPTDRGSDAARQIGAYMEKYGSDALQIKSKRPAAQPAADAAKKPPKAKAYVWGKNAF